MSEQVIEELEDLEQPTPNGELVHWMHRKPLTVGPAGAAVAAAGGFVLGVAATLTVLALSGFIGPGREVDAPRRGRLRACC